MDAAMHPACSGYTGWQARGVRLRYCQSTRASNNDGYTAGSSRRTSAHADRQQRWGGSARGTTRSGGKITLAIWLAGTWAVFAPTVAVPGGVSAHGASDSSREGGMRISADPCLLQRSAARTAELLRAPTSLRMRGGHDSVQLAAAALKSEMSRLRQSAAAAVAPLQGEAAANIILQQHASPEEGEGLDMGAAGDEFGGGFGLMGEEGLARGGDEDNVAELRAELEEIEAELEEAQDARAVAEQVNVRLKSAMEDQSLEIVRLVGLLGSLGVNASGDWTTPASDASRKVDANVAHRQEVAKLRDMLSSKMDQAKTLLQEKERLENDLVAAQREVQSLRKMLSQVQWDLERVRRAGGEGVALVYRCKQELNRLATEVTSLRRGNAELLEARRQDELVRRRLHNQVQELKGNIRVYCRMRPLLGDAERRAAPVMAPRKASGGGEGGDSLEVAGPKGPVTFSFDKVFGAESSQSDVFDEIKALVQSSVDGYRVCIFAYGQTGSGKTYTMSGRGGAQHSAAQHSEAPHSEAGMISRAVDMIFQEVAALELKGWRYVVSVSLLEIYNENLRDLLAPPHTEVRKLEIKHVDNGRMTAVTNVRVVDVRTAGEVEELLVQASEARATAATHHNEHSSRSHSVFCMHIRAVNTATNEEVTGALNLIDLAGSERLLKGDAQWRNSAASTAAEESERLKETQSINKSLSSLCDVISALAAKEKHIPYRNSKLTYLLQPYLGGDSKCLMFVNVSPAKPHLQESINSLRFASKVSSVELKQRRA